MTQNKNAAPVTPEQLYDTLKPLQEKRGYQFNKDKQMALDLLEQLLVTKGEYGYMVCPCRLANGTYEADRDILCPCAYREADVREYGACFCGLYVSAEWNAGAIPDTTYVPDRRPVNRIKHQAQGE